MVERIVIPSRNIPVVPLRNTLLFPGQVVPIVVGRDQSRAAFEKALKGDRLLLLMAQRRDNLEHDPTPQDLYRVGVLARIENHVSHDSGRSHQVVVLGVSRFRVTELREVDSMLVADGAPLDDLLDAGDMLNPLVNNVKQLAREIFSLLPPQLSQFASVVENTSDAGLLTHLISQHIDVRLSLKQELLETIALKARLIKLLELMARWRDELKIQNEIQQKVSGKLGKQQREALLREQIRTLREELGEGQAVDEQDYSQKIKNAGMPEDVEKIALDQLSRLEQMQPASPEVHIIRNYLDLLIALPWKPSEAKEIHLEESEKILNDEHYGLEKIKRRVLQHLAVMKLKPDKRGSILLFVGPPGVGKTSLARSIASALQRPYVRVSLGGVRDDAEIRGHRRTYVGALPGRIIDGIKRAGQNNPVFVLDEIDKLSRGWSGDPASALLEVLDPEQNKNFLDHYLDVPFDLSQVFFIATANSLESIPAPLLDRMEVIQLSGYTLAEKQHIARRHLWPKQLEENGLKLEDAELPDDVLLKIISGYTREAGVRELQRTLSAVARWLADKRVRQTDKTKIVLSVKDLDEILEAERFALEVSATKLPPGVATGLAWTPLGGDILYIESHLLPGKGQLTITGQLGEVMKESAQIAWTLARARIGNLSPNRRWDEIDVHLHVPAGAIPKDGPSAGVALLSALSSLMMNKPLDAKLAMTGEITLRGAVTPVGGIKEKLLAAHRAGIRKILLPKRNERDLRDIPADVLAELNVQFVENIDELLQATLQLPMNPAVIQRPFDSHVEFA